MTGLVLKVKKTCNLDDLLQCYLKVESENLLLALKEAASVVNSRRNAPSVYSKLKRKPRGGLTCNFQKHNHVAANTGT